MSDKRTFRKEEMPKELAIAKMELDNAITRAYDQGSIDELINKVFSLKLKYKWKD